MKSRTPFFALYKKLNAKCPGFSVECYFRAINELMDWECLHPFPLLRFNDYCGMYLKEYIATHEIPERRREFTKQLMADQAIRDALFCPVCGTFPYRETT